jgi:hypothetical protein
MLKSAPVSRWRHTWREVLDQNVGLVTTSNKINSNFYTLINLYLKGETAK